MGFFPNMFRRYLLQQEYEVPKHGVGIFWVGRVPFIWLLLLELRIFSLHFYFFNVQVIVIFVFTCIFFIVCDRTNLLSWIVKLFFRPDKPTDVRFGVNFCLQVEIFDYKGCPEDDLSPCDVPDSAKEGFPKIEWRLKYGKKRSPK